MLESQYIHGNIIKQLKIVMEIKPVLSTADTFLIPGIKSKGIT